MDVKKKEVVLHQINQVSLNILAFSLPFIGLNLPKYVLPICFILNLRSLDIYRLKGFIPFVLYFLVATFSIFYSSFEEALSFIVRNLYFLIFPIILTSKNVTAQSLFRCFSLGTSTLVLTTLVLMSFQGKILLYNDLANLVGLHPGYFSIILSISILFAIKFRPKRYKIIVILHLTMIFLLTSRTALMAMILSLAFFFLSDKKEIKSKVIVGVGLLSAILILGFYYFKYDQRANSFEGFVEIISKELKNPLEVVDKGNDSYLYLRIHSFKSSLKLISRDVTTFIFGYGAGDSLNALSREYERNEFGAGSYYQYNSHNQYLTSTLNSGIIGLTALLFLFFNRSLRYTRLSKSILLLYLVYGLTESFLQREQGIIIFTFVLGILINSHPIDSNENRALFSRKKPLPTRTGNNQSKGR